MADKDEALHYLLNKLKSDDGWSGSNLAWNVDKLSVIADMFRALDGAAKVKVLVSFMSMTPRTVNQCATEMNQVLRLARRDGDEWVRLFASVLGPFPDSQKISSDHVTDQENLEGLAEELEGALNPDSSSVFTPHEYAYLNQSVLSGSHGYSPPSDHAHFILKKKPQASVQLRNEILHRAGTDFSQTGSLVKDRHSLQRQMSASLNSSTPFVPTVRSHSSRKAMPIPSNRLQRERGTKLLNIDEVPISSRRKRKTITAEESAPAASGRVDAKKHPRTPSKSEPDTPTPLTPQLPTSPQLTPTPDYAAGLGTEFTASSMYSEHKYPSGDEGLTIPTYTGQRSPPAVQSPQTLVPPAPQPEPPSIPEPSTSTITPSQPPPAATPTAAAVAKQPNKGLKLSRHQLLVAQEMFKESPTLTKAQKTLILGFMAGARDNPNPDQPVVTIKLNERQETEEVAVPGGGMAKRNILYETVFEMNYTNGQWRKLQIKRAYPVQQPFTVS